MSKDDCQRLSGIPAASDSASRKIRIFCVEQNPLLRDGISYAVNGQSDLEVVGEATSAEEATAAYSGLRPDLTLIDLNLPGLGGVGTIRSIRKNFPTAKFLLLTTYADDLLSQDVSAVSVEGYLSKHILRTDLLPAIRTISDGGRVVPFEIAAQLSSLMGVRMLTAREIEILRLVDQNKTRASIATSLAISEEIVAAHIRNILQRLHATDAQHALTIARNRGHLEPQQR
ncbi:DNA-binding response regulator, NarL/FixJ family, contains REC and HTH domains [Bryocella elongata]|uniref:DNA-binding response regulator, NarL/FixJ family, contains REC and HTH domains n=1 Tax=Bryocella elongata TaxID=863522 RepID=A0A1H5VSL9_9BACT|nr:response regulator transcription factor [Bryocella elongata]SEF90299.1 DNA-binding response regulator, NarL/FixJ family, contains REC and HTH domains [Bryocella elongata]